MTLSRDVAKPARLANTWTDDEWVTLADMWAAGEPDAAIAAALGRSANAVRLRIRRNVGAPIDGNVPCFGRPPYGPKPYWTRERMVAALRDFARRNPGELPTNNHAYNRLKKGHMEWPTAAAMLTLGGSMAAAWEAAGVPKGRYSRGHVEWSQADDDTLLDLAGTLTLKLIARRLGRSWAACKRRLYDLEAGRARDVPGYLSLMQVAAEYNCPLARVKALVKSGELPAFRVTGGHYWRVDPADCERIAARLRAPKRTHTSTPPSLGDYDRRYGYRRVVVDGRVKRVERVAIGA